MDRFIRVYPNILRPAFCNALIQRFELSPNVIEGKVDTEKGAHVPQIRSCLELNIANDPAFQDLIPQFFHFFQAVVGRYEKDIKDFGLFPTRDSWVPEQFRMKKYRAHEPGQDYFRKHVDVNSRETSKRFLVLFFYLNTVQEGGETTFPAPQESDTIKIKPEQGSVLCFPPMWMYPHTGEPPLSNDKYICGSYLHYR